MTDLSFTVDAGSVFAFLGSNGAGKSTTIGCITTTLAPTEGQIEVNGYDVVKDAHEVRRSIGVVFQNSLLDPLLTVRENLAVRAGFYGLGKRHAAARIDELSELIGLSSFMTRRYGQLSGGQQRRTDIARALIHSPAVVFLDEPTAGLDPQSRDQIWKTIQQLRASSGTTVFLTTHYMEETERADSVCIIDRGEIVAQGTPAELRARYSSSILTVRSARPEAVLDRLAELGFGSGPRVDGEDIVVPVESSAQARTILAEVDVDDFEFRHGTMDDVFLAVTREAGA
ncbi:ABC transporter ATP-binding protein [Cellulomonas bogoriensis]|uniref:ABC transporter ATP-binding protein n=1 Tax=Cellulomonas bogoriensis TaxID=301388 RepID=UPI000B2EE0AA|nr:ABC transporter ATP-binding protein [Cellulomonas bogoriensis]